MNIPSSMIAELSQWNSGKGIDLESWVGCEGRFSLAIGYLTIFWPEFEEIEGYIFRKGVSLDVVREFQSQGSSSRLSIEATINQSHLIDLQHRGCMDSSSDKLFLLGHALKEIYEAKLKWQFPDRPCKVHFRVPENPEELESYELTFWQTTHEVSDA